MLSRETYQVAMSFRSERPKYAPGTFPVGLDVPPKPIEVYDWMECGMVDYGYLTGVIPLGSIDPRDDQFFQRGAPVEDLEEIQFDFEKPGKTFKIGKLLVEPFRTNLIEFIRAHQGDFSWMHHNILGIDPLIAVHKLNEDPDARPIKQKRRSFNLERYAAINDEIKKLIEAGSIREAYYPDWLANVVMLKKTNGKWRVCTDFTDLNWACPKDCFPLPRIDQLVDVTSGHQLLSFMDAYSGYNQIRMDSNDEEKTTFITTQGLYCYKVLPFGLKNAGATYQRLINKMFEEFLGKKWKYT